MTYEEVFKELKQKIYKPIYFLQTEFTPAIYSETAVLYSKNQNTFTFEGSEMFYFAIDGVYYTWAASSLGASGSYTAKDVATSINSVITGTGAVSELNGLG